MGPAGRLVTIKRSGVDGAHFPLTLSSCSFGRGIECDIRIQLPVVSKQHCKIEIRQQEATLINFSSSNPTQLNGAAIDQPVRLRHGDVITIVDRSFRYEDASHQDGHGAASSAGRRRSQESLRRLSASAFYSGLDGKVPDSEGRSEVLGKKVLGGSMVRSKSLGGAARRSPENRADRTTPELTGEPKGRTSLSPFQQLYKSMKEELDARAEKENAPRDPRRKSGPERKSAGSSQPPDPGEQRRPGSNPVSPGCPRAGAPVTEAGRPSPCPQPSSRKRRRSEALGADAGRGSPSPGRSQTPVKLEGASVPGEMPEKPLSKKQRRLSPSGLAPPPAALSPTVLAPRLMQGLGEAPPGPRSEKAAVAVDPTDVSNCKQPVKWAADEPGKRRRVSFGGRLRPELFDENLPPNTPLKRGEMPQRSRSLAPTMLKAIIKEQPPASAPEAPSGLCQEVASRPGQPSPATERPGRRSACLAAPQDGQPQPANTPEGTARQSSQQPARRSSIGRSQQPARRASVGRSQQPARRASVGRSQQPARRVSVGRSQQPARRASVGRSQQGLLQMIYSKRRSGASGANLVVAKSWADVVRLGAKQTQTRVSKRAPLQQPQRRQRRIQNTPKKPVGHVPHHFSTGHANSPCTITIGRAHLEKVSGPARPQWMLNHLGSSHKAGFPEDLSGLAEMFQTPGRGPSPRRSTRPAHCSVSGEEPDPAAMDVAVDAVPEASGAGPGSSRLPLTEDTGKTPPSRRASRGRRSRQLRNVTLPTAEGEQPAMAPMDGIVGRRLSQTPRPGGIGQELSPPLGPETAAGRRSRGAETPEPGAGAAMPATQQQLVAPTPGRAEEAGRAGTCPTPEPAGTPGTSRQLRTPSRGVQPAAPALGEPVGLDGRITAPQEAAAQDPDPAAGAKGSRRGPRTPRVKAQPLEDLDGLEELFRTPKQVKAAKSESGPSSSAKPEPAETPSSNQRPKTPSRGVSEPPAARATPHTPGRAAHTHTGRASDAGKVRFLQETPKQDLGQAEGGAGVPRRPRTPRVKAQPLEDLDGLEELFRTPKQVKAAKSEAGPSSSAKPEPAGTPSTKRQHKTPSLGLQEPPAIGRSPHTPRRAAPTLGEPVGLDGGVTAPQEAAVQNLDPRAGVKGSRRGPRTPRVKAQPLEDLVGLEELFRTPKQVKAAKSEAGPSSSAKPEPAGTPSRVNKQSKASLRKEDVEGESPAPRKYLHTLGRATPKHGEPPGNHQETPLAKGAAHQDLGRAEGGAGVPRRPRTPRVKAQPLEDLDGLEELFRTPKQVKAAKSEAGPSSSAKPEPAETPSTNQRPKTPSRGVSEPPAARATPRTPGRAAHTHTERASDAGKVRFLQETPKQDLGQAEGGAGVPRRPRTPRVKAQPLEDLDSLEELFRTPKQVKAAKSEAGPSSSAKPEPAGTPSTKRQHKTPSLGLQEPPAIGRSPHTPRRAAPTLGEPVGLDGGVTVPQEAAVQNLDPRAGVKGSRRGPRTPRVKAQPLEDLDGLEELFRTPKQVKAAKSEAGPSSSAKPEPAETPSTNQRPTTPSRGVSEPPTARVTPHTPGRAAHTHTGRASDAGKVRFLQETPKQDLGQAEGVGGSRRRPGTPKIKVQLLEDLTGLRELFQSPEQAKEPGPAIGGAAEPCAAPQCAPVVTSRARQPRAAVGPERRGGELPARRRHPQGARTAAHTGSSMAAGAEDTKPLKEAIKPEPVETLTGSRRQPRKARLKVEASEGPAEPQPPEDTDVLVSAAKTPRVARVSPPDEITVVTARTRRLQAPTVPGPSDVAPSASRRPAQTASGRATRRDRVTREEVAEPSQGPAGQKLEPAERAAGSRRQPRTARTKTQAPRGPGELRETPEPQEDTGVPVPAAKTPRVVHPSPPAESTVTTRTRRLQAPTVPGPSDVEPSASRRPTRAASGRATRADQATGKGDAEAAQGPAGLELEPAGRAAGSRRQPRTARTKAQAPRGPAELRETPEPQDTDVLVSAAKTPRVARASPPPKTTVVTTSRRRQLQATAVPGHGDLKPAASRRPTRTASGTATRGGQASREGGAEAAQGPGQELEPAGRVAGSRRQLRAKAQAPGGPAELREPPRPSEDTSVLSAEDRPAETPRSNPQADSAPQSSKRRQPQAPRDGGGGGAPALGRATRAAREAAKTPRSPAPGEESTALSQGTTEQKSGLAARGSGSRRPLPTQAQAQAEGPAGQAALRVHFQLPQPTGLQAPEPAPLGTRQRPTRTPRRRQDPQGPPVEEPKSSGDLGESPSQGPALPPLPAGRVTRGKRRRPETAAEEKPVEKKQRVAPPEPAVLGRERVRARRREPTEEQPSGSERADGTQAGTADQGRLPHSRRPKEANAEEPAPESLGPAKTKGKRERKSPLGATQSPELPRPQGAVPTDAPDSRSALRPARGKRAPLPSTAEQSPDTGAPGKAMLGTSRTPKATLGTSRTPKATLGTSRTPMVPVQQESVGQNSKPRVTRGSKRGGDDADKENHNVDVKKLRLRSRRERAAV